MFRFTKKPSSGSHSQYLAKITSLVQCRYRRRTDVVSVMAACYAAIALTTIIIKKNHFCLHTECNKFIRPIHLLYHSFHIRR
jgi:hypothetical protein